MHVLLFVLAVIASKPKQVEISVAYCLTIFF